MYINICVCICVCMYTYSYTFTMATVASKHTCLGSGCYIYKYGQNTCLYMYIRVYIYVYVCTYIHVCIHMYICIHIYIWTDIPFIYIHVCAHINICIYIFIYIYMYICICVCTYIYIYTFTMATLASKHTCLGSGSFSPSLSYNASNCCSVLQCVTVCYSVLQSISRVGSVGFFEVCKGLFGRVSFWEST